MSNNFYIVKVENCGIIAIKSGKEVEFMLASVKKAVATGKLKKIEGIVQEALDSGCEAGAILNVMTEAMDEIGQRFQAGRAFHRPSC